MTADTMTKDETIRLQAAEIEKLRDLLRDILADQQTAHWHEDIKEALGE